MSRISFDVNCSPHQAPSVKSVGITGQLTGSRADLMILDDVEVPGNSLTEFMREKLLQLCTEAESILTPKSDSRIMYLGTPQTTFTIYRRLAERNYRPLVWPARYPRSLANYEGLLAPQLQEDIDMGAEAWDVTDPDRFDAEIIMTFLSGSLNSVHNTNAPVIHDLPTPRNACTCKRFGPFCR